MIYNIFFIVLLAVAAICAWRICVADWRRRIIPDAYLFPLLLIGLAITHFFPWPTSPADGVIAAIFGYALAACVGFIFDVRGRHQNKSNVAPAPIGMGDIKLMAAGGIWLGTVGLAVALIVACVAGIIWGLHRKQKYIPFAPFFIIGGILSLITMVFLI